MGLFDRMYNGKNRADFTADQLPDNRFALFFEMFKIRFFKLIQLNLLFLIFMIPFLIVGSVVIAALSNYMQMQAEFLIGSPQGTAQMISQVWALLRDFLVAGIPCMAIMGVGLVGMTYVTRNWARDQHAWVWSDFIDSIKQNWKQGLLMGIIDGVLLFAIVMSFMFYTTSAIQGSGLLMTFLASLMMVLLIVFFMFNIYIWPMIVTYDLKLRHQIRNAMVLTVGKLPWSFLFFLIAIAPVIIAVIFPAVALYYLLIGFALTSFINVSLTNWMFDKYINVKIEGAPVNQGLREEDEDEEGQED